MEIIQNWVESFLREAGVALTWIPYLKTMLLLLTVLLLAFIVFNIARSLIVRSLHRFFLHTKTKWDDILIEYKVFSNLAHIVPAIFIKVSAPLVFSDFPNVLPFIMRLTDVYIIIVIMIVILAFLKALEFFLSIIETFKDKPLASYFQLSRIFVYIITGILVFSVVLGKDPIVFVSAFGAISAIVLLIFKDTILGLVASVQISSNDMVRVGDWVQMPKFNADGDVIAMNLNTVKVRNFDKTITTVPTFYFITDSFKNWRGMQESGGRRIKRPIFVNIRSIKFVDPETRERFKKYFLISEYVSTRQLEIERYNLENNVDTTQLLNGRRMTNIGVFRKYAEAYLRSHNRVRQDMTLLVRQLPATENGLPIEIYCFTNTTIWAEYEGIQADIFDHLLAAAQHFELEVFQSPSGSDIIRAGKLMQRLVNN